MKQVKLTRILALLKSAQSTGKVDRLRHDPADSSVVFFISGVMYEIQWDDKEYDFELVEYKDRKSFIRHGYINADYITELIWQKTPRKTQ